MSTLKTQAVSVRVEPHIKAALQIAAGREIRSLPTALNCGDYSSWQSAPLWSNHGDVSHLTTTKAVPILDKFAKSPRLRLTVTLVLTVVIGVISSVLASQIMPNGVLDWSLLPTVSSFWILSLALCVWLFVNVRFLNYDQSVLNFLDDDHCRAYIRKAKLEGIAETIRNNPEKAELIDAKLFLSNLGVKVK